MSSEQDGDQSVNQETHADGDAISVGHNFTINHFYGTRRQRKRTNNAKLARPLSWKKPVIWVGGAVAALAVAVAAVLGISFAQDQPPSHSYSSAPLAPRSAPSLGSLSITESHGTDELVVPIYNPQSVDEQVQDMRVDVQWLACPTATQPPPPAAYAFGGDLKVLAGHAVVGIVTPKSGADSGASIRAIGSVKVSGGCIVEVKLDFRPPALLLRGKATTVISVTMPNDNIFTLSKATPVTADGQGIPAFTNVPTGDIQIPDFLGVALMEITVRDSFGDQSSSCDMSQSTTC